MKLTRSKLKQMIREDAAFTKKYDNSRKLKGKQQSDLPDALQKAIISAKNEVSDTPLPESESFKPHKMFDPKTGKSTLANTYNRHLELAELGFVHEKTTVKESKMKITKTQLRQIIRESMYQYQNPSEDNAIGFPPEAFGGGGPDMMRDIVINEFIKDFEMSKSDLVSAVGELMELTPEDLSEFLTNAHIKAYRAMSFDEKHGQGREARIGQRILKTLRNQKSTRNQK
tara:strand:+ start:1306 stop:1989 length:684 start_codon:yes stop_codon:yes gene_type:complete